MLTVAVQSREGIADRMRGIVAKDRRITSYENAVTVGGLARCSHCWRACSIGPRHVAIASKRCSGGACAVALVCPYVCA